MNGEVLARPYEQTWRDGLLIWIGALLGALIIKLLTSSCRVTYGTAEPDGVHRRGGGADVPIYVAWHQRMFGYFEYLGRRHVGVMISLSRDGELVSRAAEHLGFRSIRGSSTLGGVPAMRELLRDLRGGKPVGFLADGPKGPPRRAKMGPIAAARDRGNPIVPLAFGADRRWVLKSWDRYYLPKPFSRLVLLAGDPIRVSPEADKDEMEAKRIELEETLNRLALEADTFFQSTRRGR
ncbi:MAG: lysophospholipid acyltransferase family protein [Planctomycetota bacterium]